MFKFVSINILNYGLKGRNLMRIEKKSIKLGAGEKTILTSIPWFVLIGKKKAIVFFLLRFPLVYLTHECFFYGVRNLHSSVLRVLFFFFFALG